MDVYVARQPIFNRNLKIYGYELLYRQSMENRFSGIDDDLATMQLLYNSFLVVGLDNLTDGSKAFINFSKKLIASDVPSMLPKENTVMEILERNEVTPATIDACKKLRSKGYKIALDDFVLNDDVSALMNYANIVKIEYPSVSKDDQYRLIKKYSPKVKFLAEKIETREDFQIASDLGYDFFQGYFFSKPVIFDSKEITPINLNILCIYEELNKPEPNYDVIARIIERDLGLSYKLLKLVNSAYFASSKGIKSIHQALCFLGIKELYKWISLIFLKSMWCVENAELIKVCCIRARLMELMAKEFGCTEDSKEYFFTGMFSMIDVLLDKTMEQVMDGLPLPQNVKYALLGKNNNLRRMLEFITACESADWDKAEKQYSLSKIETNKFMDLYLASLKWARNLEY